MHHVINLTTTEVVAAFASFDAANACVEKFTRLKHGRSQFTVAAFPSGPEVQDWYAMNYRALALEA